MERSIDIARSQIAESARVKEALLQDTAAMDTIARVADLLVETYRRGNKSLWAGNGGSAADAQHMAAELVNKFRLERSGMPAVALTVDSSILTAIGNDYGFEQLFARQLDALGREGDVFVGISTSGNSRNVLYAAVAAKAKGMKVIGLTGQRDCRLAQLADISIHVPATETYKIQELHLPVYHCLCMMLEEKFFGN